MHLSSRNHYVRVRLEPSHLKSYHISGPHFDQYLVQLLCGCMFYRHNDQPHAGRIRRRADCGIFVVHNNRQRTTWLSAWAFIICFCLVCSWNRSTSMPKSSLPSGDRWLGRLWWLRSACRAAMFFARSRTFMVQFFCQRPS